MPSASFPARVVGRVAKRVLRAVERPRFSIHEHGPYVMLARTGTSDDPEARHSFAKSPYLSHPAVSALYTIRPGHVCLDIGANIGGFACVAASKGARVFACEPHPDTFRVLLANVSINGFSDRIVCSDVAIGDRDGSISLFESADGARGNSTQHDEGRGALAVRCQTLASYAESNRISQIDFLKINAEGAEWAILCPEESQPVLRRVGCAAILVHELHGQRNRRELVNALEHAGLTCTIGDDQSGLPTQCFIMAVRK